MKSFAAGLLVLLVAFVVSGCGGSDGPPQTLRPTDQPAIAGEPAGFNSDDIAFANAMITLYRQTTELTELVPERSTNPSLVALAADIGAAQGTDLEIMKVFLVQWNSNSDSGPSQGGPPTPVPGTVDDATMARLKPLTGKDFDALWLKSMISHQQGAVDMAEAEVAHGANVDAIASARHFVSAYQARIARMTQLLAG